MFGDKKLDRHRFEYAQMVRTPTPQADEKNSLHLYAASKDRDTTEQKSGRLRSRFHSSDQCIRNSRRCLSDSDPGSFQRLDLSSSRAFPAGNNRAGVTHSPSRRSRDSSDECCYWFLAI